LIGSKSWAKFKNVGRSRFSQQVRKHGKKYKEEKVYLDGMIQTTQQYFTFLKRNRAKKRNMGDFAELGEMGEMDEMGETGEFGEDFEKNCFFHIFIG
jgi:hypothetical protein